MLQAIWKFIKGLLGKISLRGWIEILIGGLLLAMVLFYVPRYFQAKKDLGVSQNNNAAYQAQLETVNGEVLEFQFTMAQLRYFNDSISKKLVEAIDKNKIKDSKIRQLEYMLAHFERTDTIRLTDTIFCEPEFIFDTVIGDEWMSADLHLEYPSTIGLNTSCVSEKRVIIHTEKVYADPPKKFFICRWFQKKVIRTKVEVIEENPYIKSSKSVFIKINE